MFSGLRNQHDRVILKDAEHFISGVRSRHPMMRPEHMQGKGSASRQALKLLGEDLTLQRYQEQLSRITKYTSFPERTAEQSSQDPALAHLYADSTVHDYLMKHPEDAPHFGLHQFDMDKAEVHGPEKQRILDKSLRQYLIEKPETGEHLGDKAMAFRLDAALKNLNVLKEKYKELLSGLPELKKRSENGFPLYARAFFKIKQVAYSTLWWIRDNPLMGGLTAIGFLILAKIALALLVLDEIEKKVFNMQAKRAEKRAEKQAQQRPEPQMNMPVNRQFNDQNPAYTRSYMNQRKSQGYGPANGPPPQAPVFPAPYFNAQPTPLQTALNMPTA